MSLGHAIIDAVIRADAVESAKVLDDGSVAFVWKANAAEQIEAALRETMLPLVHGFANQPENQSQLLALLKIGWENHDPSWRIAQIVAGATLLDFFGIDHKHLPKK